MRIFEQMKKFFRDPERDRAALSQMNDILRAQNPLDGGDLVYNGSWNVETAREYILRLQRLLRRASGSFMGGQGWSSGKELQHLRGYRGIHEGLLQNACNVLQGELLRLQGELQKASSQDVVLMENARTNLASLIEEGRQLEQELNRF